VFLAVAQSEWDLFARAMTLAGVNANAAARAVDAQLQELPRVAGGGSRVSPTTRLACKLALYRANRDARSSLDTLDLLIAVFEEPRRLPTAALRLSGAELLELAAQLEHELRGRDVRIERERKRLELPPYLKQIATNLNLLACLDQLPPVFGRDGEIQQVV